MKNKPTLIRTHHDINKRNRLVTLSDKQKKLLSAVKDLNNRRSRGERCTLKQIAIQYGVSITALHRASKSEATESAILSSSDGRGRKQRLSEEEETMIKDAALEFQNNGTPLDRNSFLHLAETLVMTLSPDRIQKLGFNSGRPGKHWLRSFMLSRFTVVKVVRLQIFFLNLTICTTVRSLE